MYARTFYYHPNNKTIYVYINLSYTLSENVEMLINNENFNKFSQQFFQLHYYRIKYSENQFSFIQQMFLKLFNNVVRKLVKNILKGD